MLVIPVQGGRGRWILGLLLTQLSLPGKFPPSKRSWRKKTGCVVPDKPHLWVYLTSSSDLHMLVLACAWVAHYTHLQVN